MVATRCLGLDAPVNSGRWAVRGLAMFPEGHGLNQDFQQYLRVGKRAGFVPLNQTELYWFLTSKAMWKGLPCCTLYMLTWIYGSYIENATSSIGILLPFFYFF
jgi:hypothetical protein